MEKELIRIFKPIFDGNQILGQLLTNSDDSIGFDELCAKGYFVEELNNQCVESMGSGKPCVVLVSKETGMFGGDYIRFNIVCLHKYLFSGDRKLRPFEIVAQMNQVINHKTKLGDGTLEMGSFRVQPLNDEVGEYSVVYNSNDYQLNQDGEIDIIEYYKNHLFDTLTAVFDTQDVKKKLLMNGISAKDFTFEELIKKEYIRLAPKADCKNGGDSVFAIIQLEEKAGLFLGIDIIGISGKDDTEVSEIRAKAKELSDIINRKMLFMPGIQQSSYDENGLNESGVIISCAYSLLKTEEEIKKAESKKKIRVNFFADFDVLQKLPEAELLIGNTEIGFSLDLIQSPIHLTFANKEFLEYGFYIRSDLGVYDEPDCGVKMYEDGGKPDIKLNRNFAGESNEVLTQCLNYMTRLAKYVHEKEIIQQFSTMEMTKEGVLLYFDEDEIKYKLLHGKQRPDLMCTSLFNGTGMMRPYQDEIMPSWGDELMPFADKLKAAENGDKDMMLIVANAYLNGEDGLSEIDTDPEKSAYWMEKAAASGNVTAMFNIGLFYAKGYGVKRSFEKAAEWMDKAGEAGDTDAVVPAEQYHSAAEAEKKIEAGDPQGQAEYAKALMIVGESFSQLGGEDDYKESIQWAQKAEGKDNGEADCVLGLAYEHGRGVDPDLKKAFSYYEKGGRRGHPVCLNNMGRMYISGEGVRKDEETAFRLFLQAAEKGYGIAMQNVGRCYQFENGTDYDMAKAIEWYEKSLEVLPDPELAKKVKIYKMLENEGRLDEVEHVSKVDKAIQKFSDPEAVVTLGGTQHEGRADRCEYLRIGEELTFKIIDGSPHTKYGIECYSKKGSVGLLSPYYEADNLSDLFKKDKIELRIYVKSCIPKSKRGKRARTADVLLRLDIKKKIPETPEEKEKRLAAERKVAEEKKKAEAEAKAQRKTQSESGAIRLVKESRESYKKLEEAWNERMEEHQEHISRKTYMSIPEVERDMRKIVLDRNDYGTQYDDLIADIDKRGKQFVEDGCSFQAVKAIGDIIMEIINESNALDIDFSTTGMSTVNIGKTEFSVSSSSKKIQKWWKNKYESMPEFQTEKKRIKLLEDLKKAEKYLSELSLERQTMDAQKDVLVDEISVLEAKIAEAERNYTTAKSAIIKRAEANVAELQKKVEAMKSEKAEAEKSVENMHAQISSLSFFKFSLKNELIQKIENIREGLTKYTKDIRKLESESAKIAKKRDEDIEELQTAVDEDKKRLAVNRSELARLPERMQRLDEEIKEATQQVEQIRLNINNL